MLIDVPGRESLQDILLICGWFHMGTMGEQAVVYGYRAKQFDSVLPLYGYEDNCNALGQKGEIIWSILWKGNVSGQYREDVRRTSCPR